MVLTSSSSSSSCASLDDVSNPVSRTIKLLCSYGGRIIPRYPDAKLRYVGGDTRVLSVQRSVSFSELQTKLRELCGWDCPVSIRCPLPADEIDALISVTSDEDLVNLVEEYDLANRDPRHPLKMRFFLHPNHTQNPRSVASAKGKAPIVPGRRPPVPAAPQRCVRQVSAPVQFLGRCHHGNYWK